MNDDPITSNDSPGAATAAGLSAAFERLSAHSLDWGAARVMDEGLDLVRDSTWADGSVLHAVDGDAAVELARRPVGSGLPNEPEPGHTRVPLDWFPWGLAPVSPRRFLLVQDATTLPSDPWGVASLGDLGVTSCLHLPILERQRLVGALQLYWSEPRLEWDDDRGRLLRLLGRFLLGRRENRSLGEPVHS